MDLLPVVRPDNGKARNSNYKPDNSLFNNTIRNKDMIRTLSTAEGFVTRKCKGTRELKDISRIAPVFVSERLINTFCFRVSTVQVIKW